MKAKTNFTLLRDLVMVFPIKAKQKSEAGILIICSDPNAPIEGFVIATGPGVHDKRGKLIPVPVKVGDRIIFVKNEAKEIKHEGDTFLIIPSAEILCKI